jgi:hypothetical protein
MLTEPDRPLLPHVPEHQRGPLMNRFLDPVRRYGISDPQDIVWLVIASLKVDIQRWGTWNFASDVTPLHQTLSAVQGHPTEALALAWEAVAYEQMPPDERARLKATRANASLREFMASKPESMLNKPPTDKQL